MLCEVSHGTMLMILHADFKRQLLAPNFLAVLHTFAEALLK